MLSIMSFFMNRVIQIGTRSSITNATKCVLLCNRTNLCVTSLSIVRGLAASDTGSNDDDFCGQEYYLDYNISVQGGKNNRKTAVSMLQDVFGCSMKECESMAQKYPELKFVSAKSARYNIQFLKEKGVSDEILHQNPWLLMYKAGIHSYKLDILKKMNLDDVTAVIPLLQFPVIKLRELAAFAEKESLNVPHGNRIKYTCEKFQHSLEDVCKVFVKHEFLFTVPFDRFAAILDLLIGAGVSPQYILRDMWIFRYSINSITERLEMAKEASIRTIKPWMLRSSRKIFSKTVRRAVSRKQVLGESSVVEYLSQQLQCSVETVEYLSLKDQSILTVHVSRMQEIFDYVYGEGYTPQHVCQVPRILRYSLETIKTRLTELRALGYNPPSLMTLCKSKREYAKFLKRVMKRKIF